MEINDLFTGTKWNILEMLAEKKRSPLELAGKLDTTIANISQQLRLLEAAGLVKTEKTRQAEKGKPRILYSIAKDFVFIASLEEGLSGKKLIPATLRHRIVSRIWQVKDEEQHNKIEDAILQFEEDIKKGEIDAIAYDEISNTLLVAGKKVSPKTRISVKNTSYSEIGKNNSIIYKRGGLE